MIAIGLENGAIILSLWCNVNGWNVLKKLDQTYPFALSLFYL